MEVRDKLKALLEEKMDYERLGVEGLSIVRRCFPPSQMMELDIDPFIQRVTSGRIRLEKRERLEGVWEKARDSIGCDGVPGVEHEAKVMVEELRQIREMIKETEDKIQELCKEFSECPSDLTIPGFGPDLSARVLGAIGQQCSVTRSRSWTSEYREIGPCCL